MNCSANGEDKNALYGSKKCSCLLQQRFSVTPEHRHAVNVRLQYFPNVSMNSSINATENQTGSGTFAEFGQV